MSRYTKAERRVSGNTNQGVVMASVVFMLCNDCGAFVGDIDTHDTFHYALDVIADRDGYITHRPFGDI